jgi:predicted Rossmann-fold nucleotide-binding protein
MKVAMIGSREYENPRKIKDTLAQLRSRFTDNLIVISGGALEGADKYVKKYALEFGIAYKEYNPAHTQRNLHSAMSKEYYDKPYHVSQFHHRNMLIARECDVMMVFIPNGAKANGSESAIKSVKKMNKPIVIIA